LRITLLTFILLLPVSIIAQNQKLVVIDGKIVSKTNDVEGITIYNKTSQKGVTTKMDGAFKIEVAVGDSLDISALQFNSITVVIDEEIFKTKTLTVLVTESVNELDEVVVLSHNLTGDISADVGNVKKFLKMDPMAGLSMEEIKKLNFAEDHLTKPDNLIMKKGQFYNGADLGEILKLFGVKFKKKKKKLSYLEMKEQEANTFLDLADKYSHLFIQENFKIPTDSIEAFYAFCYKEGLSNDFLKPENEVLLIEFLVVKSKQFLKKLDAKD